MGLVGYERRGERQKGKRIILILLMRVLSFLFVRHSPSKFDVTRSLEKAIKKGLWKESITVFEQKWFNIMPNDTVPCLLIYALRARLIQLVVAYSNMQQLSCDSCQAFKQ